MARDSQKGLDWVKAAEPLLAGIGFFFLLLIAVCVLAVLGVSALELKPAGLAYSILTLYLLGASGIVAGLPMSLNRYVGSWEFRRVPGGIAMEESIQRIFGTRTVSKHFAEGASVRLERVFALDVPLWRPIIGGKGEEEIHAFPVAFPRAVAEKMVAQLGLFLSPKGPGQIVLEHAYATEQTRFVGRMILAAGILLMLIGTGAARLSGPSDDAGGIVPRAAMTKAAGERRTTLGTISSVSLSESGMRERKDRRNGGASFIGCAVEIKVDAPEMLAGATVEVDATGSGHSAWCSAVNRMEGKQVRLKLTGRQTAALFNAKRASMSPSQVRFLTGASRNW